MKRRTTQRRRSHLWAFIGIGVSLVIVAIAAIVVVLPSVLRSHAATLNMNCTLIVPANPLSAQGLATPYQLTATNAADGACNEANAGQGAFVQGVIYDPATATFSVYSPLIIDKGTQPIVAPTAPVLPQGAVVGLWFGFNASNLQLQGAATTTLSKAHCVNGLGKSVFGQFAYCNAPAFFAAANKGIAAGKVQVPALQTAKDGLACPTTRDFGIIDQDQSDNVQTQYLANANGQTAQLTAANQAQIANAVTLGNPSDNALVTHFMDPALGCTPWQVPDLANNGTPVAALALDELQAAAGQKAPIATIPVTDPMVLVNNKTSLGKTNLYRRGVDQQPASNAQVAGGTTYCQNFLTTGLARLQLDKPLTVNQASPAPDAANSLYTFLAQRFMGAYDLLNCPQLIKMPNPITVQVDGNGVAISATVNTAGGAVGGVGGAAGGTTTGAGGVQQITPGAAQFNLDTAAHNVDTTLNITYPGHPNTQIAVQVRTDSCTGPIAANFNQPENTDGNSMNNASSAINNVQGTALPANWFFTVTDPNQQGADGQPLIVGCGSVVANGTMAAATLGTVVPVPVANTPQAGGAGVVPMATGGAQFNLDTNAHNVDTALNFTYPNHPSALVNVQVRTGSCTGSAILNQPENTDGASVNDASTVVNNVQGNVLPTNWFLAIVDPQQQDANGQPLVVGCGIVVANGTAGTATLGVTQ